MLTAEHIKARVKDGVLLMPPVREKDRAVLRPLATHVYDAVAALRGETRGDVDEALSGVVVPVKLQRAFLGLKKIVDDRSDYTRKVEVDAPFLRAMVHARAAEIRATLKDGAPFSRASVLGEFVDDTLPNIDAVDDALTSDQRHRDVLSSFGIESVDDLLDRYELGRVQAVVLKAESLRVTLLPSDAVSLRRLISGLRFRELLFTETVDGEHLVLDVDGPMATVATSTRYGARLAMLLPLFLRAGMRTLEANVRWGKAKRKAAFTLDASTLPTGCRADEEAARPAIAALLERFDDDAWDVAPAAEVFNVPGLGAIVPDLVFTRKRDGRRVFFELLGHWSREAVWKRIDLASTSEIPPTVFAVSERLRVDKRAMPKKAPSRLFPFKSTISPKVLRPVLDEIAKKS